MNIIDDSPTAVLMHRDQFHRTQVLKPKAYKLQQLNYKIMLSQFQMSLRITSSIFKSSSNLIISPSILIMSSSAESQDNMSPLAMLKLLVFPLMHLRTLLFSGLVPSRVITGKRHIFLSGGSPGIVVIGLGVSGLGLGFDRG